MRSSARRRGAFGLAVAAAIVLISPASLASEDKPPDDEEDDPTERTEPAGFPVIGGSTDIGFQFGVAGTISHLGNRFKPYWWKVDGILSLSVKGGPRGTEITQQDQAMRWDIPGGGNGKIRLMPGLFYSKTINSGYFPYGNASPVVTLPDGTVGDRYQFRHEEAAVRLAARTPIAGPWSAMYGWQLRYVHPKSYPNSRLAIDAATRLPDGKPLIYGLGPLGIATINGAAIYDTRDDELQPTKGGFHMLSFRASGATPTESGVAWLGANATIRFYAKVWGPIVFANRIIVDLMAGHVPFYDMSQGGAFDPDDMPGGGEAVRGIPNGRYAGLVKVVVNNELRSTLFGFKAFGVKFKVGNSIFFDTGRVWVDYSFSDPRDGSGLGLHYGVGSGPFLLWGSAALFRIDVAYSPDATAANPGFPVGIYVQEGFMF